MTKFKFAHERLNAYRAAAELADLVDEICAGLTGRHDLLAERLRRSALAIATHVATGAAEPSAAEKIRLLRRALEATTQCAVGLHMCQRRRLGAGKDVELAREILVTTRRLVVGLIKFAERELRAAA